jgi:hypothetical protein
VITKVICLKFRLFNWVTRWMILKFVWLIKFSYCNIGLDIDSMKIIVFTRTGHSNKEATWKSYYKE